MLMFHGLYAKQGSIQVGYSPEWFKFWDDILIAHMLSPHCLIGWVWGDWEGTSVAVCEIITTLTGIYNSTPP